MPVCILGMHRSGTSMVAATLRGCGLYLGDEPELMAPGADNRSGFWENVGFVELNDEVLSALGGAWDCPPDLPSDWDGRAGVEHLRPQAESLVRSFDGLEPWGWKDPRNSLTLPFWSRSVDSLKFVVCLRSPLNAALSLTKRNNVSLALGIHLWMAYGRRLVETVPADRRIVTHCDAYFANPRAELRRVVEFAGLDPSPERLERAATQITPELRTHQFGLSELSRAGVSADVVDLYLDLCAEAEWESGHTAARRRPGARVGHANGSGNGAAIATDPAAETPSKWSARPGLVQVAFLRDQVADQEATIAQLRGQLEQHAELERSQAGLESQLAAVTSRRDALENELGLLSALSDAHTDLERRFAALRAAHERGQRSAATVRRETQARRLLERKLAEQAADQARLIARAACLEDAATERDRIAERCAQAERKLDALRDELLGVHEQLLLRDQAEAREAVASTAATPAVSAAEYLEMMERIRERVRGVIPLDATVIVISRGDERLLDLGGPRAWHFPRAPDGGYAGNYPGSGEEAVAHLEALRAAGGEYLLIPATALWWLDYYSDLAEHLGANYREVFRAPDSATVFALTGTLAPAPDPGGAGPDAEALLRLLSERAVQVHSLLHERSGLKRELDEARRATDARSLDALARARLESFFQSGRRLAFPARDAPAVSVVIPSFGQPQLLLGALESLLATASEASFELVIVDNASPEATRDLLERLDNVRVHLNERNHGFGAACTTGAELARGRYVCFLNSDTIVSPGWLAALVETAERYPDCGAVGAKLVHPDGRLQEAGSIVWKDGSAWAYGRGGDPSAPEFSYRRQVDYCSAACLLVERSLFRSLGGFDERYAPAYYEDTDLCLAIWDAGRTVVYEPRAVVFHLEFGSSTAEDSIALQLRNRARFNEKWEHQLAGRLAPEEGNLVAARDRRDRRSVLVIDDRIPEGGQGSGFPRAAALLHGLAELGYAVTFLPSIDRRPIEPATSQLQALGIEVLHSLRDVHAALLERAPLCDAAIVSRPHNLPLAEVIRGASERTAIVYDAEAVYAVRDFLRTEAEGGIVSGEERARRIRAELQGTDPVDLVLTVSDRERLMIEEHGGGPRVAVWGDSLSVRPPRRRRRQRRDLLFVGSLATPPNADAVSQLLTTILSRIRPIGARLLVVGANPEPRLWSASLEQTDRVLFTGYVEDLAPVYESARVFVAPHRFAAGVPHKVIEAMAHGVPCVISRLLGDQLEVEDGAGALVADNADEFAAKVMLLYRSRRVWREQQRAALALVSERYEPGKMLQALSGYMDEAMTRRDSTGEQA